MYIAPIAKIALLSVIAYISTPTTLNYTLSTRQKKAVQDSGGAEQLHKCNQRLDAT